MTMVGRRGLVSLALVALVLSVGTIAGTTEMSGALVTIDTGGLRGEVHGDVITASDPADGNQHTVEPARYIARVLAARGQPVYEYRFSYVAQSLRKPARLLALRQA